MTADKPSPFVPKVRFPEFIDHGPWDAKPLDDLCDRLSETVGDTQLTPVSISAGKGFVPQAEKFGRDISDRSTASTFGSSAVTLLTTGVTQSGFPKVACIS